MSTPVRRPVAPKMGNSFLTRQLSLQSPTQPIEQPQPQNQLQTCQHRKLAFRRQSSEDLSIRRGRRRGRDTPSPAPSITREKVKSKNSTFISVSDENRTNTSVDNSSDGLWSRQVIGQTPAVNSSPALFNKHFPQSKGASSCPTFVVGGSGPVGGRPITPGRPRHIRLAWGEKRSATFQPAPSSSEVASSESVHEEDVPVEVVAKKVGQPKPMTGSVIKAQLVKNQHSLPSMAGEKDSVLQTRQQLADKLRRAWWGEDQLRPNLDIFLTCLARENNGESTPPSEEAPRNAHNDGLDGMKRDTMSEQKEGKKISIKIDTASHKSGDNSKDNVNNECSHVPSQKPDVEEERTSDINSARRSLISQSASPQLCLPLKSSASPISSKIQTVDSQPKEITPTGGLKTPSNHSLGHAAGNEIVCGQEINEEFRKAFRISGREDNIGSTGDVSSETALHCEPSVSIPAVFIPCDSSSASDASTDLSPATGAVTNSISYTPPQGSKVGSEARKDIALPTKLQATAIPANEGKGPFGISNASLKRAQFRNSSMNRRTVTRSVEVNPGVNVGGSQRASGDGAVAGGSEQGTPSVTAVTLYSRANCAFSGSSCNLTDSEGNRAKEDVRRGIQQTQEGMSAERNAFKRNAESAGITRASSFDAGEIPQQVEGCQAMPSMVPTRPSTALRPADRSTLRSAPSFVSATAAKHRQKVSSKRKSVRRSAEDDEGAEGEGVDLGKGTGGYPRGKGGVRGAHADVVTMVSLVSPTGSDTDEPPPQVFSFPRDPTTTAPAVPTPVAISSRNQKGGMLSRMLSMDTTSEKSKQKKLHKSVSFQSDTCQDEEEQQDVFSRRPAFPASLIIPRVPPNGASSASSSSTAESSSACTTAPVVIPQSASLHVPKIVDPCTPRNSYCPPNPSSPRSPPGWGMPGRSSATPAAPSVTQEEGKVTDAEKGKGCNRKKVMFRSRSASLKGSAEMPVQQDKSMIGGHVGSYCGTSARSGATIDMPQNNSLSKKRSSVVVLPERQDGKKVESKVQIAGSRGINSLDKGKKEEETPNDDTGDLELRTPEFKSAKEKECWELYRRMCDKGLSVSYDTILRGMLTPTEYRMRRTALLSTC